MNLKRFRKPSVDEMLIVHYPSHGEELTKLHHLYCALKADLEEHFAKEERSVFPLMHQFPIPFSSIYSKRIPLHFLNTMKKFSDKIAGQ